MSNVAVRVEGLGKLYRIGGKQERYRTLRDSLTDAVSAPFKRARSLLHGQAYGAAGLEETIWALKDVSFEVKHGEVVGIIGRNGAGKSTLLKILSRITEPTEGYADVYGRVGALLEVGTGFHPELTGRENIYLNGAILGMGRAEIDRKFDEIVDFAGVEKFIDTPVKHYSSGMGLRLGFAVAAHLEPEILVVDEVLAVGDAQFQKKCLSKMSDVANDGRTVLFVSHNMTAVKSLCTRGVLLSEGYIKKSGNIGEVIHEYQKGGRGESQTTNTRRSVSFSNVMFNGGSSRIIDCTQPLEIQVSLDISISIPSCQLFCIIQDSLNNTLIHARIDSANLIGELMPGTYRIRIDFPPLWIRPDVYTLHFKLIGRTVSVGEARYLSEPIMLEVIGNTDPGIIPGILTPRVVWNTKKQE